MTDLRSPGGEELENDLNVLGFLGTVEPLQASSRRERREQDKALGLVPTVVRTKPASRSASRRAARHDGRAVPRPNVAKPRPAPALDKPRPVAGKRRPSLAKAIGSRLLSFGAMLFAGALAIGMSMPANAFNSSPGDVLLAESAASGPVQTLKVDAVEATAIERDGWVVMSWAEVLREKYGTRDFSYTVGTGPIRWPFPYAVPISSGFGERVAPCRGCSSYHQGLDFNPGNGAPIYAIADGVVTDREDGYGGFGNYIVITHTIDGETVTSTYAHMQRGSSAIVLGQEIKVGDFLGLVGQTGQATGPHLHFEIAVDGVKIDPFTWLQIHTATPPAG